MKKLIPMIAVAALATMFTSCKKEYTCTCSTTIGGVTTSASGKTTKMTKKDAKAACEKSTTTAGITVSCKLD